MQPYQSAANIEKEVNMCHCVSFKRDNIDKLSQFNFSILAGKLPLPPISK